MKRILITDRVHEHLLHGLVSAGAEVEYRPKISLEEARDIIANYEGIVINSKIKMDHQMIERGQNLEFIARLGSGLEIIDINQANKKGIAVYRSPEGNANAVGEHALGMLLCLLNNLLKGDKEVRSKTWRREQNRGMEICGKVCGIIGYGHTGSNFAAKMAALGAKVLVYDKYLTDLGSPVSGVYPVDMLSLCKEADIISFHVPLSEETEAMLNSEFLQNCKDGVIFINTSRGAVVHLEDLLKGLNTEKIGGACLDVFENEKPSTYSDLEEKLYKNLFILDNVVLSPHVAGWTKESLFKIADSLLRKISKHL